MPAFPLLWNKVRRNDKHKMIALIPELGCTFWLAPFVLYSS